MRDGTQLYNKTRDEVILPVLSDVDVFSSEQSITKLENIGFFGQFKEQFIRLVINEIFRIVKEN
jgi:hypothetical protein